jgi:hypothetical protein
VLLGSIAPCTSTHNVVNMMPTEAAPLGTLCKVLMEIWHPTHSPSPEPDARGYRPFGAWHWDHTARSGSQSYNYPLTNVGESARLLHRHWLNYIVIASIHDELELAVILRCLQSRYNGFTGEVPTWDGRPGNDFPRQTFAAGHW